MELITSPVAALGRFTMAAVGSMGALSLFFLDGMLHIFTRRQFPKIMRQVRVIGAQSCFLIALIGVFTGMVLGLQGYYALSAFGSEGMLGSAVSLTLVRELGPVLTAIMVTGRAGSAMAAEIGVMRISDQIDALEVMDINPLSYMVSPRLAAALISFPLLTAIFDVIGIFGGYLTSVALLGLNGVGYMEMVQGSLTSSDISGGFVKSLVFSVIVTAVCCYKGYYTHLRRDSVGPEAVSNSTTSAVVLSSILILTADYVLTSFLL